MEPLSLRSINMKASDQATIAIEESADSKHASTSELNELRQKSKVKALLRQMSNTFKSQADQRCSIQANRRTKHIVSRTHQDSFSNEIDRHQPTQAHRKVEYIVSRIDQGDLASTSAEPFLSCSWEVPVNSKQSSFDSKPIDALDPEDEQTRQSNTETKRVKKEDLHRFNQVLPFPGQRIRPSGHASIQGARPVIASEAGAKPSTWKVLQSQMNKAWSDWSTPYSELEPVFPASPKPPLGLAFSPAGLLLPYHLGVAECLRHFGVLTQSVPISGASAGALAVACVACELSSETAMQVIYSVEENLRRHGAARRLHSVLKRALDDLLPIDAHYKFNTRDAKASLSYTKLWPFPKGQIVWQFSDREDLKDCIIASCNIPFYFSKWPTVKCRGSPCVDGYFAVSSSQFGCPTTSAVRNVRVMPFSAKSVRVSFPEGDCISPDLQEFDNRLTRASKGSFPSELRSYLDENPAPVAHRLPPLVANVALEKSIRSHLTSTDSPSISDVEDSEIEGSECDLNQNDGPKNCVKLEDASSEQRQHESDVGVSKLQRMWGIWEYVPYFGVAPAETTETAELPGLTNQLLPKLRYSVHELLRMALDATDNAIVAEIYDLGRADAFRWIKLETMRHTRGLEWHTSGKDRKPLESKKHEEAPSCAIDNQSTEFWKGFLVKKKEISLEKLDPPLVPFSLNKQKTNIKDSSTDSFSESERGACPAEEMPVEDTAPDEEKLAHILSDEGIQMNSMEEPKYNDKVGTRAKLTNEKGGKKERETPESSKKGH